MPSESSYRCILCGSSAASMFHHGVRDDEGKSAVRCDDSSLAYLEPRPAPEELDVHYSEVYPLPHDSEMTAARSYLTELPESRKQVERLHESLAEVKKLLGVGCSSGAFLDGVRPLVRSIAGGERTGNGHGTG